MEKLNQRPLAIERICYERQTQKPKWSGELEQALARLKQAWRQERQQVERQIFGYSTIKNPSFVRFPGVVFVSVHFAVVLVVFYLSLTLNVVSISGIWINNVSTWQQIFNSSFEWLSNKFNRNIVSTGLSTQTTTNYWEMITETGSSFSGEVLFASTPSCLKLLR